MKTIEYQIKQIISESISHKGMNSNDHEIKEISYVEGNGFCSDCNSPSEYCSFINE